MKKIYYFIKSLEYFYKKFVLIFKSSRKRICLELKTKILILFFFHFFLNLFFINRKYKKNIKDFVDKKFKYKFSNDWFTDNIPIWNYIFEKKKIGGKNNILEIGSYEGMSALFLLEYFKDSRIDCIETFKGSDEHEKIDFTNVKNNFLYNLDNFKERSNLFEDTSDMFFEKLNKDKKVYDIIYIDGSHHSKQVFKDAENSFNCIKINGLIIFDDFLREYYDEKDQNTIGGALSFLEKYKNKVKLEFVHYQLFITKIRK